MYWRWRSLPLRKQVRLEHYRRGLLVKPENMRRFGREADTCRRSKMQCPLLALGGQSNRTRVCQLLDNSGKVGFWPGLPAIDPKRTSGELQYVAFLTHPYEKRPVYTTV